MTKVGYFGIEGSYSYFAALKYFNREGEFISYPRFEDVFDAVVFGEVEYGVIPVHNTIAGPVAGVQELLGTLSVRKAGEIVLPIEHCLLGVGSESGNEERLKKFEKVYAHPQALAQCSVFLDGLGGVERVSYQDNASAARFVSESGCEEWGAIASEETGKMYGLEVLARYISNLKKNDTTFIIIQ